MVLREWRVYLLLVPGLVALGCGEESSKRDAGGGGGLDGGRLDGAKDRSTDLAIAADATDSPLPADARPEVGIDAQRGEGGLDGVLLDGAAAGDVALDARDVPPPRLDGGLDGQALDGGTPDVALGRDAPSGDGASAIDATLSNRFVATLTGAEVVPMGKTAATGTATFELSATGTALTYHVAHGVADATAVAIFSGPGGENGSQVFDLTPLGPDMTGTLALTATDLANLESGLLYVSVQSTTHPDGELRGQILRPGESLWVAKLTGGQESPPASSGATGHAALILGAGQSTLRFHVAMSDLTASAVRIQVGIAALASGPVAYDLTPVSATMDGVLSAISATDVQNLADRHWYLNAPSAANPSGEIRGQILLPGETLYAASLDGSSETPPVDSTATGAAQFILDPGATTLSYDAVFVGLVAIASHIHVGAPGVSGPVVYPLALNAAGTAVKGALTVTATDVANLDAAGYYINAHTTANPSGEIRGQITKQ